MSCVFIIGERNTGGVSWESAFGFLTALFEWMTIGSIQTDNTFNSLEYQFIKNSVRKSNSFCFNGLGFSLSLCLVQLGRNNHPVCVRKNATL